MKINQTIYDGSLIHKRFAYKFFKDDISPYGNIVSFISPMEVKENLIDLEDSLNDDFIHSDWAFNFCWEIPNVDIFGSIAFQRLFIVNIANILQKYVNADQFTVDGDDILIDGKKASVSIAYTNDNASIGHIGINIVAGREAPDFAYSTRIQDTDSFINEVENAFNEIVRSIFIASTKISL